MIVQKRRDREGQTYFSFIYTDPATGKRVRLKKAAHPTFTTREDAERWAKTQKAYQESEKAAVARRMAWLEKYADINVLVEDFRLHMTRIAPNSHESSLRYLRYYVMPFFLTDRREANFNNWHIHFADFLNFLETDAQSIKKREPLTYSTKNHIISTLNNFVELMGMKNIIAPANIKKCPFFSKDLTNKRGFDDILEDDEFVEVHKALKAMNPAVADFFYVLRHTGMRFNELFGLQISSLFKGHTTGPLHDELISKGIEYYGYIVLESQIADDYRRRDDKTHAVPRKPLKSRKKIHPKNNRTIPIMDKSCWNILARRFKEQDFVRKSSKAKYGTAKENYFFFEDVEFNTLSACLRKVYERVRWSAKSFHCLRHTYATFMVGRTRSYFLAKTILGHRSDAFEQYNHIFEMIGLKAKQNEQVIEEVA